MKYDPIDEPSRGELALALSTGEPERITRALLALAFADPDWQWVQDRCLELLVDNRIWVRRTAATCLGHLARIHHQLNVQKVMTALSKAAENPDDRAYVETAIEEIKANVARPS